MANTVPSRYVLHAGRWGALFSAVLLAAASGCSRSGLDGSLGAGGAGAGGATATTDEYMLPPPDASTLPDAAPSATSTAVPPTTATATEPPPPHEPNCIPSPEKCNGIDDDCNGSVDDGLPAIPCPGGGNRLCVAGKYSACPTRCEACLPGSERVCFLSYCTYWATETCSSDGRSFGTCREAPVPPECAGPAGRSKASAELEQCCLDNGYCCHDEFDLDGDGDSDEMLGACDQVSCGS